MKKFLGIFVLSCWMAGFSHAEANRLSEQKMKPNEEPILSAFDAQGLFNLAMIYEHGTSVTQNYAKAKELYEQAAVQGHHAKSQYNLGVFYMNGLGVPQDYEMARYWYEQASAQGMSEAHFNLGALYANGWGVAKDMTQAKAHFKMACDAGIDAACNFK